MIRINQIKLPPNCQDEEETLQKRAAKLLRVEPAAIRALSIMKKSIDARKKPEIYMVYTVDVKVDEEQKVLKKCGQKNGQIQLVEEKTYEFPKILPAESRPVIVGTGPAGLFCGYMLAKAGYRPILLERGREVHRRLADVGRFWRDGILDPVSNVQFGEGGAGTFSDGKLTTTVKDPKGRMREALRIFVEAGAPKEILYEAKPHLGTDILTDVVVNLRKEIEANGGEVRFEAQMTGLRMENGHVTGVEVNGTPLMSGAVILAIGHSARDTFQMLSGLGIPMEAKAFAVGLRMEHPREMIDRLQYGASARSLPAASYSVTAKTASGRGVYSFCMCPGGFVVNASSEEGGTCVNGMSYAKRDTANANSAIIVSVTPADYGGAGPLAGVEYQRRLERAAYALGGGRIPQQLYGDYVQNETSSGYGAFASQAKGKTVFANLRGLLSSDMERSFIDGMTHFSHFINGFDRKDAILSGMETRTSSPVRILRNEQCESAVAGIYPCGEGAGYAGGIMSAAMDGLKVASAVMRAYAPPEKAYTGRRARGPVIPGGYDSRDKE